MMQRLRLKSTLKYSEKHLYEVVLLQQRLKDIGFYYGDIDGYYGYLTRDAVCSFQKAFGLKVDGIAGEKVISVLNQNICANRILIKIDEKTDIQKIASANDTTVDAILESNPDKEKHPPYIGETLNVDKRCIIDLNCNEQIYDDKETSFFSTRIGQIGRDGELEYACSDRIYEGKTLGIVSNLSLSSEGEESTSGLNEYLKSANYLVEAQKICYYAMKKNLSGIIIDFSNICYECCDKLSKFFRILSKEAHENALLCCLSLSSSAFENEQSYDVSFLANYADIIIVEYGLDEYLCSFNKKSLNNDIEHFDEWLLKVKKRISPWKSVVTLFSGHFKVNEDAVNIVSQDELNTLRTIHCVKKAANSDGLDFLYYREKGKKVRLFFESSKSLGYKLHKINKYNFKGIAFTQYSNKDLLFAEAKKKFIIQR